MVILTLVPVGSIIRVIKSKRMSWAGHVALVGGGGRGEMHKGFGCGNLMERDTLEDLGVDGRTIMELFSNRLGMGIDWIDLVQVMVK
jgi:hypothetical protein